MYTGLQHAHSGLRWLVLFFLIAGIITAWQSWKSDKPFNKRMPLLALIFTHLQLVIGLILYFISPLVKYTGPMGEVMKDSVLRFYTVEHTSMMLIAIALITVGYSKGKRKATDVEKGKTTFLFYLIGFIIVVVSIPWPFRNLGAGWF